MRDPAFPVFCAVGAGLCLVPLPWHWQARNVSTLLYLGWISTACLVSLINSLLWAGNVEDKAPVWCDISTRFTVCLNVATTSAGLCIQRRLYRVAAIKEVTSTEYSRKRELAINLLLGLGLPVLMIPLYSVVQPIRYLIVEDFGCWPATYPTLLTTFMCHIWPVLISLASFVYAALTIRAFLKTRRQFSKVLSESGSDLSLSRFFRLMALAATDMACGLPLSLYFLISDLLQTPLQPYASWAVVHEYIGEVDAVTYEDLKSDPQSRTLIELTRWTIPGCAFLFFMYFGLSAEAIKQYKRIFWRFAALFGLTRPPPKPKATVSWTRRLVPGTATTTVRDDIAIPSPAYTNRSRLGPFDELDDKQETGSETKVSVVEVNDLENQVDRVERKEREINSLRES